MQSIGLLLKRHWKLTVLFGLFAAVYVAQAITSVPSGGTLAHYHISGTRFHELSLTVAVPYMVIWFVGLAGYVRLQSYVSFLGNGRDGPGFRSLATGVLLATLWLPTNTLLANSIHTFSDQNPSLAGALLRLLVYGNIVLLLAAFYYMMRGSDQLVDTTKTVAKGMSRRQMLWFVGFAAVYTFLTFRNAPGQSGGFTFAVSVYGEPDWLALITIVIPRLITWYFGFSAAAGLVNYSRGVRGKIYKRATLWVATGIAGIASAIIILRTVQSLSRNLDGISLVYQLSIVYTLLLVIGLGNWLLAAGAKRLQRIEEL